MAAPPTSTPGDGRWTDEQVEAVVGNLLRWGVIIAAVVAAAGAVLYLAHHGSGVADYHRFVGTSENLTSLAAIVRSAATLDARALIQLGLVLLIATPVARVALSLFAFAKQGDHTYVAITAIVLALLLYSLAGGGG